MLLVNNPSEQTFSVTNVICSLKCAGKHSYHSCLFYISTVHHANQHIHCYVHVVELTNKLYVHTYISGGQNAVTVELLC